MSYLQILLVLEEIPPLIIGLKHGDNFSFLTSCLAVGVVVGGFGAIIKLVLQVLFS